MSSPGSSTSGSGGAGGGGGSLPPPGPAHAQQHGDHDSSDVQSSLDAIANDMQKYGSEAQIKAIEQEMMSMDNPGLMKDPSALDPDVLPNSGGGGGAGGGGAPPAEQTDSHVLESPISDEENSDVHLSLPPRPEESPTTHPPPQQQQTQQQQPQQQQQQHSAYTSPMQDISSPTMRDRSMMDRLPSIPGREPVGPGSVPPPEYPAATYGPYPGSVKSDADHSDVGGAGGVIRSRDVPSEFPQQRHPDPGPGFPMGGSLPPLNSAQGGPPPYSDDRGGVDTQHRRYSDGIAYPDQSFPPNTDATMSADHRRDYRPDFPPTTPRSDTYKSSDYPPNTPRSDYPPPTPRSDYPPNTPRSDYGAPPSIEDNHSLPMPPQVEHNQHDTQQQQQQQQQQPAPQQPQQQQTAPPPTGPQSHMSHHGSVDNSPENVSTSGGHPPVAPPTVDSLPPPASTSSQMPIEHTSLGPPPPFHYDLPPYSGGSNPGSSSVIRQSPYGYGYPDPLDRSRSVLPSLPGAETSQSSLFPPAIGGLPSRTQDSSLYPSSYADRSFYGQYLPPPMPSMSDRSLPSVTQSLPDTTPTTSAAGGTGSGGGGGGGAGAGDSGPRDGGPPGPAAPGASGFNVLGRNADLLRRSELERTYSPSHMLGHQMGPPPPQPYMGPDDRARHWAQASPLSSLTTPGSSLASKDPAYPNLDTYGQKTSAPSFSMPPRPEDPMSHLDVAGAYFGRHFGSTAANTSYNRQEPYRHTSHMPDYRGFPHQAGGPPSDMFGRVGVNPTLGLDKYYYPGNPMYRPQHMGSTGAPFIPPPSTGPGQKGYGDADYSRTAMYAQPPGAYPFDKQYLKPSQYFPGAPPHAAPPQDLQDPYRRSVIYNMMDRYY